MDFESLNFDERFEGDKTNISHENLPTEEDGALQQEASGQTAVVSSMETKDIHTAESVDKEQSDEEGFQDVGVVSVDETPGDDYTSSDGDSEQEGSVSGDDEEDEEEDMGRGEKPGDLLMSVHCGGGGLCDGDKEDRIFAEGQPLAPEGAENPQVRNEEQGESESDEEVSYFERVPGRGSEMLIKGGGFEEDEQEGEEEKQEDSDSECEGMKIEQEEDALALCFEEEDPHRDGPAKASVEFPEISVQNLQDLVAEVDSEEYAEKMKDFSGEEHQEAGESIADYPSDFSSCEYVEDGGKNQESGRQSVAKQDTCLERAATDVTWMERAEEDTDEEGDEYLHSIELEVDADRFRSLDVAAGGKEIVEHVLGDAGCDDGSDTGESDSYSSSDDEFQVRRSDKELVDDMRLQDLGNNKHPEESELDGRYTAVFARWSTSDEYSRADPADFNINWNLDVLTSDTLLSEDLLTTEDANKAETLPSHAPQRPAEDINTYSVVQREDAKTTSASNQGSLDDSFFFNAELEASGATELGQLGDDEYEDERNWEQEQERIRAFYRFYDDSDGENGREGE